MCSNQVEFNEKKCLSSGSRSWTVVRKSKRATRLNFGSDSESESAFTSTGIVILILYCTTVVYHTY